MSYDDGLSFAELRRANIARQREVFAQYVTWSTAQWITALVGEMGELANMVKKRDRGEEDIDAADIARELADIAVYTDLLAYHLGVDLADEIIGKFNEVSMRTGSTVKLSY